MEKLPIFSSRGKVRPVLCKLNDFKIFKISNDELHSESKSVKIGFSLIKGSYATVFLRELIKSQKR